MTTKVVTPENLGDMFEFDTAQSKIIVKIPKTFWWTDNLSRSFTTTYADGYTTGNALIRDGLECRYHVDLPARNDAITGWGGGYAKFFVSVDGGAWVEVGHSGYQLAMHLDTKSIATYSKTMVLPRGSYGIPLTGDYKISIKLQHRSYSGDLYINKNDGATGTPMHSFHEIQEIVKG